MMVCRQPFRYAPERPTTGKGRFARDSALSANMFARTHLRLPTSPPLDARGTRPESTFREALKA